MSRAEDRSCHAGGSLLLIAAIIATMSALVLAGLRHFHPFRFGRLEYTYDETWCPSPPRLILFPDGKVDMTIVEQHDRTILIQPTRSRSLPQMRRHGSARWSRQSIGIALGHITILKLKMAKSPCAESPSAIA